MKKVLITAKKLNKICKCEKVIRAPMQGAKNVINTESKVEKKKKEEEGEKKATLLF